MMLVLLLSATCSSVAVKPFNLDISTVLGGHHWFYSGKDKGDVTSLNWSFFVLNCFDNQTLLSAIEYYLNPSRLEPPQHADSAWVRQLDVGILTRLRFGVRKGKEMAFGPGGFVLEDAWVNEGGSVRLRSPRHGALTTDWYDGLGEFKENVVTQRKLKRGTLKFWI